MSKPSPSTARCPFAPLAETSSISRDIGFFSLNIEPDTCTLAARPAAAFAAARICSGDLDSRPLPEELDEPPQPARAALAIRTSSAAVDVRWVLFMRGL